MAVILVCSAMPLFGQVLQDPVGFGFSPQQTQPPSASIAGTVRDSKGTAIAAMPVTLVGQNNGVNRLVRSDSNGAFTFDALLPGNYQIKLEAPGFEPFISEGTEIQAGAHSQLSIVLTQIPTQNTTITVTATPEQVAEAQAHEQEKQRIFGFLPDFYTSYLWTATPMTPKLKFQLGYRSVIDPVTFLVAAGLAGVEQHHNTFPGYGQGAEGYAKRFGAAYADTVSTRIFSRAIFPTLLHQDPRYFYRGSGSVGSRMLYAIEAAVVTRGDNGQLQPNYSQMAGAFAASGLSNVYRAPGDRQLGLTLRNGLIIMGTAAAENVLREFVSRKLTPHVPNFAKGRP
jgi:Carboxypeptidase regulatory-like domain